MSSQIINDSLPLEALGRIDNVCTEFEESLKTGLPSCIEDLLIDFEGPERIQLLLELLLLELAYRRVAGDAISLDEYLSRFPDDQRTVREAIDRPTPAFGATLVDSRPAPSAVTFPARIKYLGDYEILEEIARGGMGMSLPLLRLADASGSISLCGTNHPPLCQDLKSRPAIKLDQDLGLSSQLVRSLEPPESLEIPLEFHVIDQALASSARNSIASSSQPLFQ